MPVNGADCLKTGIRPSRARAYPDPNVMYDTARPSSPWYWCVKYREECVMLTRNGYLAPERIYPLASLSVGIVFTFGCIGLLGYGMLAIMGY